MTAIPYEAVLGLAAVLAVALALALYRISRLTRCVADNPDSSAGAFATPDGEQRPADAGPDFDGWFLPACIFTADGRARTVNRAFLEWHGGTQAGGLPEKSPAIARLRLAASREGMRERDGGGPAVTGAPLELTAADGRRGSFHAYFSALDPARNERCCVLVPAWGGEGKGGLADIFEEAPFGVVLVDRTGRIKAANQTLSWLFGAAAGSPIGADLTGFARETDRAALASLIERAASGDGGEMEIELRPDTPDRKFVSAVVHPAPEEARRRDAGEVVIYLIDNSSRRELEERMIQSQKMQAVGQLAGGIAHDFNNLLTAMSGFCDLLLARHGPGDPSFADIMQISQNANRAANLVRQLLAFSRRQRLVARVIDVTETLADLSHLLRRLIGSDIDLRITHGRGLKPVLVDQSQLEQVLVNLVVNARDAISNAGVIQVETRNVQVDRPVRRRDETLPVGDYVLIEVIDTGSGIPETDLDRVFEPFFSTKEIGAGTGLGLSTVYGIVKQTSGFVFVESAVGRGTTFSIYLPAHDGAAEPASRSASDAEGGTVEGDLTGSGTVLLVEDEDPVRLFAARALRGKGYSVIEARTGENALAVLRGGTDKIDLLITDVMMPGMDGPSLIRETREILAGVPVICISGYSEDALGLRISEDAGVYFLAKPFSLKQLASKVKEVLRV